MARKSLGLKEEKKEVIVEKFKDDVAPKMA